MEITNEVENSKLPQFSKQQLDDLLRTIYQLHSPPQGGKRRLKPPRRVECGERLFGNVDPKKVVDLFIAALEHVPTFEEEFKLVNHKLDFDAGILHILVQSFFIWMEMYESKWRKQKKPPTTPTNKSSSKSRTLISTKNATVEEDFRIPQDQRTPSPPANRLSNKLKNMAQISGEQNANNNGPSTSTPSPAQGQQKQRILIHPNHRNRLLDLLIPIDFTGKGPYIWKAIFNILELKNQKYLTTFIARVLDFVEKGKVSFTVLHYCFSHSNISGRMAIPKLLPTALLLGSLDAQTVEQFVANRTEQFRAECRRLLLQAESWKLDEKKFQDAVQEFTHRSHLQVPSHAQFNTTLTSLLSELRKEVCVNQTNLVNDYWAISLIRSAANKYYKEKSWSADQFNDLIHTLLVQRPAQKSFLLNVLLKDHNDKQAWERWRNFVSSDRIHMSKNFQKMSLYSKEDSPEFLSLPRKCDVFFIGNVQQFCIFKKQFEEYEQKKQSTILCGIDAEWNSYVMKSSASLLQISLTHSIYLLDLDALHVHPDFLDFIDRFFMSTEIVKIGYQFSEDLVQMRQRLPNCIGLYRPANIYCIGKIVDELHRRSRTKLDFQLNQFLLPITEQEEEAMKEHTRQVKPGFRGRGGGNNGNNRAEKEKGIPQENGRPEDEFGFNEDEHSPPMAKSSNYKFGEQGLSYLCRSMLGKPLNKLEQCSVWDRRPLRSSQIRYAALDAHCLIRLFQRCKEWCVALDAGDDPLYMVPVSCLHVSLPLFWNKPLPANLPESAIAPWQQQKEEEVKTNDGSWDEDELKNNDGWGWKDVVEENGGQPADGN